MECLLKAGRGLYTKLTCGPYNGHPAGQRCPTGGQRRTDSGPAEEFGQRIISIVTALLDHDVNYAPLPSSASFARVILRTGLFFLKLICLICWSNVLFRSNSIFQAHGIRHVCHQALPHTPSFWLIFEPPYKRAVLKERSITSFHSKHFIAFQRL